MSSAAEIGYEVVRGVTLRANPARDPRFTVVGDQSEMVTLEPGTPESLRELLHTSINNEVQSLEVAAQSLVEFPDAPWDLRMCLARQCWDETRHVHMFLSRLLDRGGWIGEFPIINQEWGTVCSIESLAARLAVQNVTFEAGSLDVLKQGIALWLGWGDAETAGVIEAVLADEIGHTRFGDTWLKTLQTGNPRVVLDVVRTLSGLRRAAVALAPPDEALHEVAVNSADRALAGLDAGGRDPGSRQ